MQLRMFGQNVFGDLREDPGSPLRWVWRLCKILVFIHGLYRIIVRISAYRNYELCANQPLPQLEKPRTLRYGTKKAAAALSQKDTPNPDILEFQGPYRPQVVGL